MEDLLKLKGKNIVVMGVANERSLAWGVAKSLYKAEANVIYTYRLERSFGKLTKLLEENHYSTENIYQCDVNDDESIHRAFTKIGEKFGVIDGIVHCVAFAHAEDLKNPFVNTSREGFSFAHDTSAYSLVAVAKEAKPYMTEGGSIVTMSYLGAERAIEILSSHGSRQSCIRSKCKIFSS